MTVFTQPCPRQPMRKGMLYLIGSTDRPNHQNEREGQGVYVPVWHLVRLKRRANPMWTFRIPDGKDRWGIERFRFVKRLWAYVARCGARKGWALPLLTYGLPTCKRCRKKL